MSCSRVSCRGYLLLEVLAYLGIMMLIMFAIMGVVTSVRRGLLQKALHERQTEEWAAAAEFIRARERPPWRIAVSYFWTSCLNLAGG